MAVPCMLGIKDMCSFLHGRMAVLGHICVDTADDDDSVHTRCVVCVARLKQAEVAGCHCKGDSSAPCHCADWISQVSCCVNQVSKFHGKNCCCEKHHALVKKPFASPCLLPSRCTLFAPRSDPWDTPPKPQGGPHLHWYASCRQSSAATGPRWKLVMPYAMQFTAYSLVHSVLCQPN